VPGSSSVQLNVLSSMNEHLASENAALIAELAKLQRKQRSQDAEQRRQKQIPALVAGIPTDQLESLLSIPGTLAIPTATGPSSSSAGAAGAASSSSLHESSLPLSSAADEAQRKSDSKSLSVSDSWHASHSALHQRAQDLVAQVELTQLRAECEVLRAEAAEAATQTQTKQGVVITLQRQLNAAHAQHQKEVKELKKATKQVERRAEDLVQQLPKTVDDSSVQVSSLHPSNPMPCSYETACLTQACCLSMMSKLLTRHGKWQLAAPLLIRLNINNVSGKSK